MNNENGLEPLGGNKEVVIKKGIRLIRITMWIFGALAVLLATFISVVFKSYESASILIIFAYTLLVFQYFVHLLFGDIKQNLLGTTILAIILSPFLVYAIVLQVRVITSNGSSFLIQVADSKTWIGFAGSILGGSITMLAVFFTIQNENKKHKLEVKERQEEIDQERALIFMPVINCVLHEHEKGYITINQEFGVVVKNVSNNILRCFTLTDAELYDPILKETVYTYDFIKIRGATTNLLVSETLHTIVINGDCIFSPDENINRHYHERLILKFKMHYQDITLKNRYFHETEIRLSPLQSPDEFSRVGHRVFKQLSCSNEYIGSEKIV